MMKLIVPFRSCAHRPNFREEYSIFCGFMGSISGACVTMNDMFVRASSWYCANVGSVAYKMRL